MKNSNQSLCDYLSRFVYTYRLFYSMHVIISFSAALFLVLRNYQVKNIIDGITRDPGQNITILLVLFVFYNLVYQGFHFCIRLFAVKYTPRMLATIIQDMYLKTMGHSLHWFDSHLSGAIAAKIVDIQDGIITVNIFLYKSFYHVFSILISLVFLYSVHYLVAAVTILFMLIYTFVMSVFLKRQMVLQAVSTKSRQEAVGIINDSIANVFSVKVIGSVATEFDGTVAPAVARWKMHDRRTRLYDAMPVDIADTILSALTGASQIWMLAYFYKHAVITAGDFAFCMMVSVNLARHLDDLLESALFSINPKIAAIQASYKFINAPAGTVDAPNAVVLSGCRGDIVYDNVTFGYSEQPPIFSNLNLHIKAGTRVGIVGASGAGKTTLIKGLLRYFDVQGGRIVVDGYDIRQVTQESLRAQISVIPQDTALFHRSIIENLRVARPDATLDEIHAACKRANIHADIERMSDGYNSIVGERGVKLSGGQRQRIAIARALLKNAPILILDEATSALDTPTEHLIQESINQILTDTPATTLVVAHRLSTLAHMDRILVLEGGVVVEEGTHAQLLALNGRYKVLWDSQTGGFLPDSVDAALSNN